MTLRCPLCDTNRPFTTRRYSVVQLRREWLHQFGFDAFAAWPSDIATLQQHRCARCDVIFFMPLYVGDGAFYQRLSRHPWYYEADKWAFAETNRILSGYPEIETLLEVGCGHGYFLEQVAGRYRVLGSELNRDALRACQRKGMPVLTGDLDSVRGSFECIVAFDVLEHLPQPAQALSELHRLLAAGGLLVIALPNPRSYMAEFDHILLDLPPHHATRWNAATFAYVAQRWGLDLVETRYEPLRYSHYRDYMAMLAAQHHTGRSALTQIKRRLHNTVLTWLLPFGYQHHKQILLGQSQLVVLRKPGP